jgi:hypothetical protein
MSLIPMTDDARDEKALVERSSTRPGDIKNVGTIQVEELEFADGFHAAVRLATEREHMLTFRQALRL